VVKHIRYIYEGVLNLVEIEMAPVNMV